MQWCPDRGIPQNVIYEFHCVIHFRFVVCEEKTPNPFTLPRASRQPPSHTHTLRYTHYHKINIHTSFMYTYMFMYVFMYSFTCIYNNVCMYMVSCMRMSIHDVCVNTW